MDSGQIEAARANYETARRELEDFLELPADVNFTRQQAQRERLHSTLAMRREVLERLDPAYFTRGVTDEDVAAIAQANADEEAEGDGGSEPTEPAADDAGAGEGAAPGDDAGGGGAEAEPGAEAGGEASGEPPDAVALSDDEQAKLDELEARSNEPADA